MKQNSQIEIFKAIFLGDSFVGKTSFCERLMNDKFDNGILWRTSDFFFKTFSTKKYQYKIQFWDTKGHERFYPLTKSYFIKTKIRFFIYDITYFESFEHIKYWLLLNSDIIENNCINFLIGNKIDLDYQRNVSKEEGLIFAKNNNLIFLELSIKNNYNISNFYELLQKEIEKKFFFS